MSLRTRALPALVITAALTLSLSGCGTTTPPAKPAGPTTTVGQAAPGLTLLPDPPTATARPKTPRHTPAAGSVPATLAPSGKTKLAVITPSTRSGGPAEASSPGLTLSSYDVRTGEAVLAPAVNAAPAEGAPSVRAGQLIDSPPTPAAPRGALLAVTAVRSANRGKTSVSTRPATIAELLGNSSSTLHTALDPRSIEVQPQVKDLKVSFTKRPDGGNGSVSGGLKLDADTTIPLPHGASVTLAGSLELDPAVDFSYQGAALHPDQASVGFELGARANWRIRAAIAAPSDPIRIPLAKLMASPVVMVGPVPVVINLDLTLYAKIGIDGTVTLDVTQQLAADWGIRSDYAKAKGWTTDADPGTMTISPLRATLTGKASVRTGLAIEGSVALYDAVGLKASIEPYLRTAVEGSATIDSSGAAPTVTGTAALYGGLDINGALMARIAIVGTPIFEKELPFPVYHREWPIATRTTSTTPPTSRPSATATN
ncbi:hypothetical protein J7F03_40110 [Streptomyces sp. ISL-43]|uniref:hypothetical protein n=1 Tax=Streptomyces sp. ISL-43 TaxID=2819183 RepID=UPI001BED31CA|nr:hypothetical protein [Streptomyces sp. ISL-43]MBT2453120.1 hypothetical protein [Streptomyces sp. ISL-43]